MNKPLITHIAPRENTKRARECQARAAAIVQKRLLELGAHPVLVPAGDSYLASLPLYLGFETVYGPLEFVMHQVREGSSTVAVFGRFTTHDPVLITRAHQEQHVSRNGKWNHYQALTVSGLENLLGELTRAIPHFLGEPHKPRLLSAPNY